jgi:hypothetical protein
VFVAKRLDGEITWVGHDRVFLGSNCSGPPKQPKSYMVRIGFSDVLLSWDRWLREN